MGGGSRCRRFPSSWLLRILASHSHHGAVSHRRLGPEWEGERTKASCRPGPTNNQQGERRKKARRTQHDTEEHPTSHQADPSFLPPSRPAPPRRQLPRSTHSVLTTSSSNASTSAHFLRASSFLRRVACARVSCPRRGREGSAPNERTQGERKERRPATDAPSRHSRHCRRRRRPSCAACATEPRGACDPPRRRRRRRGACA